MIREKASNSVKMRYRRAVPCRVQTPPMRLPPYLECFVFLVFLVFVVFRVFPVSRRRRKPDVKTGPKRVHAKTSPAPPFPYM